MGAAVERIGDGGVVVGGETVAADAILLATGVAPATALAEAAGIEVGDGILVDELLRTSAGAVYAAGDVANTLHPRYGRIRVEHWDNAIAQGEAAARSMLGKGEPYAKLPYFFTDQYDLGMEYVGRHEASDELTIRGSLEERNFRAYWSAPGRPRHGRDARQRLGRDRSDARARRGGRDALERLRVGAAHARAVAEVGAVHVQRDRDLVARVVHPVDVVGRGGGAGRARRADRRARLDQAVAVELVERLGLGALQDQERAPDDVVVDLGDLAGAPDDGGDREGGLGVERVAGVAVGAAGALVLGEERRRVGPELLEQVRRPAAPSRAGPWSGACRRGSGRPAVRGRVAPGR